MLVGCVMSSYVTLLFFWVWCHLLSWIWRNQTLPLLFWQDDNKNTCTDSDVWLKCNSEVGVFVAFPAFPCQKHNNWSSKTVNLLPVSETESRRRQQLKTTGILEISMGTGSRLSSVLLKQLRRRSSRSIIHVFQQSSGQKTNRVLYDVVFAAESSNCSDWCDPGH